MISHKYNQLMKCGLNVCLLVCLHLQSEKFCVKRLPELEDELNIPIPDPILYNSYTTDEVTTKLVRNKLPADVCTMSN